MTEKKVKQVKETLSSLSDTYVNIVASLFNIYRKEYEKKKEEEKNNKNTIYYRYNTIHDILYNVLCCAFPQTIFTFNIALEDSMNKNAPEELNSYLEKFIYYLFDAPRIGMNIRKNKNML